MNPRASAFDLLAEQQRDWRPEPYHQRRERLETAFTEVAPPLQLVPATDDQDEALLRWLDPANALVGIEEYWSRPATSHIGPGEQATGARSVLSGLPQHIELFVLMNSSTQCATDVAHLTSRQPPVGHKACSGFLVGRRRSLCPADREGDSLN